MERKNCAWLLHILVIEIVICLHVVHCQSVVDSFDWSSSVHQSYTTVISSDPLLPCVYNGTSYDNGEEWKVDECTTCNCDNANVTCVIQSCEPAICDEPFKHDGECCFLCPNAFFEVRLVDGSSDMEGRVEVKYNRAWGTICDDGWDLNDANVVCKMLNESFKASSALLEAPYGAGSGNILLDEVDCTGTETRLEMCKMNPIRTHDCGHNEDAGIICTADQPKSYTIYQQPIWSPVSTDQTFFEVRLMDGRSDMEGRVEVQYNGTWGTMCDDGWDLNDANVVCRMLNESYKAVSALVVAPYGPGSGDILLDEVDCTGTETRLEMCKMNPIGTHDCGHNEDAGIVCTADSTTDDVVTDDWNSIHIDRPELYMRYPPEVWSPVSTETNMLEVRLVNQTGGMSTEGRVEVKYNNGTWGTVCDDGWDLNDANVVCRMLGFFKASEALQGNAIYGPGSGDILLDEVDCQGTESNLLGCTTNAIGEHDCGHDEDASIVCTEPVDLEVRLVDGPNNNTGRVEVLHNGAWGTVCDDYWESVDAEVVCSMLGFFGAAYAPTQATYGEGSGDILINNVDCIGTESNLGTCFHDRPERFTCDHDEDAGAACLVLVSEGYSRSNPSSTGRPKDGLNCPNQTASTDEGLATSSNITIDPYVLGFDGQNVSIACTYTSDDVFRYGVTWVGCTARADANIIDTCVFTVTVTDNEAPKLDCPDVNSTTDPGKRNSSSVTISPSVSDNANRNPVVTCSRKTSDAFGLGETNVTCEATDHSGNIGRCSFVVAVRDEEPPTWVCSRRTTTMIQALGTDNIYPPVEDNTDKDPTISCSHTSRDLINLGDTSITCQAEDVSGNSAECTFVFTVQDPCVVHQPQPCVNGRCQHTGSGQYECVCQDHYEGKNCDVIRKPTQPVSVGVHPQSQTVEIGTNMNLTCNFHNAEHYQWYKDENPLPKKANQGLLYIANVSVSDIGYYFCRGYGNNRQLDTNVASVYIKNLTNIRITNMIFVNTTITSDDNILLQNISNNIQKLLVRNDSKLKDLSPTVICKNFTRVGGKHGTSSLVTDCIIYIKDSNLTAFEEYNLMEDIANKTGSFYDNLDLSKIRIQHTAICSNATWVSPRFGQIHFPEGENNMKSFYSTDDNICPFNTTNAEQPIGRAKCVGDLISQSTWDPQDNCGPFRNVSDLLNEISQVNISDTNVAEVGEQVSVVTSNTNDITSDDIASVKNLTTRLKDANQGNDSIKVTESIVAIVSNIAEVDAGTLESAEQETGSVSGLVDLLEKQIDKILVKEDEPLSVKTQNIAVMVQSVPSKDISNGLVVTVAGDSSDLTSSNTTIQPSENNDAEATSSDIISRVDISPSVASAVLSSIPSSNATNTRVTCNILSRALYISKSLQNYSSYGTNRSVNTHVISLSIGTGKVENLPEYINFTFTQLESDYTNPICSFWDEYREGNGDWSKEGCYLLSELPVSGLRSRDSTSCDSSPSSEVPAKTIVCGCNHLTSFAVLMDVHREEQASDEAYKILTYIGCSISILSLLVTLGTYLSNRVLREKQTNQIFVCLCLTLLSLYISFIVMISLDTARDPCKDVPVSCSFITALIHYFVLSSISWMGVEGYNTYLIIVKIFDAYIPKFMLKSGAVAWGIPALIVIMTAVVAGDKYVHEDLCFLQVWSQVGGLLIPVAIILIFNVVIFTLVVRQLVKSSNITGRVQREAKVERRERIERVQNAVCILLLLGLTWIVGYLLMIKQFYQVVEPIFIVLNSFQGLFIFLLYCVRKPMVRKQWGLTCFDAVRKRDATTTSGSHSMSMSAMTTKSSIPSSSAAEENVETSVQTPLVKGLKKDSKRGRDEPPPGVIRSKRSGIEEVPNFLL